jgi:hypothetical protein
MRYKLSDSEWGVIKSMLPNKPRGIPRVDDRRVLNGIFWVPRVGSAVAGPAGNLRTLYDLLQSVRPLAAGVRLGPNHGGVGRRSRSGRADNRHLCRAVSRGDDRLFVGYVAASVATFAPLAFPNRPIVLIIQSAASSISRAGSDAQCKSSWVTSRDRRWTL